MISLYTSSHLTCFSQGEPADQSVQRVMKRGSKTIAAALSTLLSMLVNVGHCWLLY